MSLRRAQGFSLIEVLVAVLVVAVGVLGIVGLQLVTLRENSGAMMRSQATQFAYNIIDRVRANPGARANYAIALNAAAPAMPVCEGAAANCSPATIATYDLATWLADVAQLPEGDGAIAVNGSIVSVTVQWTDRRDNANIPANVTVASQVKVPAP